MTILTISTIFDTFDNSFGNFDDFFAMLTIIHNVDKFQQIWWSGPLIWGQTQPNPKVMKHFAIDIYLCHEFCLHFVPDRVPPCETWPILTTFALSKLDQMLHDCKN